MSLFPELVEGVTTKSLKFIPSTGSGNKFLNLVIHEFRKTKKLPVRERVSRL